MSDSSPVIRYYFSEMAVSDRHGGGLTLQGVLGPDLDRVRRFFTVGRFALDRPAAPALLGRCEPLTFWSDRPGVRRWPLRRPLAWWDRAAAGGRLRAVAARLRREARAHPGDYWLLCPQGEWVPRVWNGHARPLSPRYVTWMMDDHVVRHREGHLSYPASFRPVMERHLRQAAHVFVISPAMREFYRDEFGVESTVLFGGASEPAPASAGGAGAGVRLAYFGSIFGWQSDALVALAEELAAAGATLDVYTAAPLPPDLRRPGVAHRGFLPQAEVRPAMGGYDAVVLPISRLPEFRHMTDLNIATKMGDCLASGTVTLVLGPPNAAMVRYVAGRDVAVVADYLDRPALRVAVARCRVPAERSRLVANAARLVTEELLAAQMRRRWDAAVQALPTA